MVWCGDESAGNYVVGMMGCRGEWGELVIVYFGDKLGGGCFGDC